jgi:hypothetical protein
MEFLYNDEEYNIPGTAGVHKFQQLLEKILPFIPLSGV